MKKTENFFFIGLAFLFGLLVMSIVYPNLVVTDSRSYKQGQIDALTGKIKYHLVTQSDSTKVWKSI